MGREAVILAGGLGTRLRSVISDLPKPMAPVCDQPFLHYLFRYLKQYDFTRVVLSVGFRYEAIEAHFGNSYLGIEVAYAVEEEPLGTGGGIALSLKSCREEEVLILNGDTFFDLDLNAFYSLYTASEADLAMAVRAVKEPKRYGTVELDGNNWILGFREKREDLDEGFINGGVYLMSKHLLEGHGLAEKFSLEQDFFEPFVSRLHFKAFQAEGYFIDIGIPTDYNRANEEFASFRY